MRRGQAAAFRRLTRTGHFHLEVLPGIDHELFARVSHNQVGPVVTERILLVAARTAPASGRVTQNPCTGLVVGAIVMSGVRIRLPGWSSPSGGEPWS